MFLTKLFFFGGAPHIHTYIYIYMYTLYFYILYTICKITFKAASKLVAVWTGVANFPAASWPHLAFPMGRQATKLQSDRKRLHTQLLEAVARGWISWLERSSGWFVWTALIRLPNQGACWHALRASFQTGNMTYSYMLLSLS